MYNNESVTPVPRLIVSDLDGTLLGEHSALIPENAAALRKARAMGIEIAIASGRIAKDCSRIALEMGLERCHILGLNGAHSLDNPFGATVMLCPYPDALCRAITEILSREECVFNLYARDAVYTNAQMDEAKRAWFRGHFEQSGCGVTIAPDALARAQSEQWLKVMIKSMNHPEAYARALEAAGALPGVYITASQTDSFDIMLKGVGKAEAVADLAKRLDIPLAQVMALGDYYNDEPMLRECGLSVAMGNAKPGALAAARYMTKENTRAGVAYAVESALEGQWEKLEKPIA